MRLYRFSPIDTPEGFAEAVAHIHRECHRLCGRVLGRHLPVAGNLAVFCHYEREHAYLQELKDGLCYPDDPAYGKYYRLREPMEFAADGDAPAATYSHLYVRRPDPYRHHVGDLDFLMAPENYDDLKSSLLSGMRIPGLRTLDRTDTEMLELHDPDSDALAYIVKTAPVA